MTQAEHSTDLLVAVQGCLFDEVEKRKEYEHLRGTTILPDFVTYLVRHKNIGGLLCALLDNEIFEEAKGLLKLYAKVYPTAAANVRDVALSFAETIQLEHPKWNLFLDYLLK